MRDTTTATAFAFTSAVQGTQNQVRAGAIIVCHAHIRIIFFCIFECLLVVVPAHSSFNANSSQGLVNLDFSAASGNSVAPLLASVSIRWIGFIRPSKSGEYTFSIQPQVRKREMRFSCGVCGVSVW